MDDQPMLRPSADGVAHTNSESGLFWDLIHVVQGMVGLAFLWDLAVHTANQVSLALTGGATVVPMAGALGLVVSVPCGWVCDVVLACVVAGIITYAVLKLLCSTKWVQEEVRWEECWEEFRWYNPWSWVKTLVCVTKTALQWVLKQICNWVEVLVVVLVVICILAAVVVVLA